MQNPFKFLDAYTKEDKDIFFGRDHEIEELYQKVFDSKVLLVCGVSGTGKTSLINCGLANKFEDSDWLPVHVRRGVNITESLWKELEKVAITPIEGTKGRWGEGEKGRRGEGEKGRVGDGVNRREGEWEKGRIGKAIQSIYLDHFKPIYLIFDQFEEVFIFGSKEERQEFISEVVNIVDSNVQCRLLFVMREEYLAGAIEFEREIPTFLTNRIRIEKMTWSNARHVIEEPCKVYGIEVEEGLAENMLGKLSPESTEIELTYLQVLLDKLYRQAAERDKETPKFTIELLTEIGDVSDLLGSFLEEQIGKLDDPETGMVVLKSFVSVKGTKRQVTFQNIADFTSTLGKPVTEENLKTLIQRFIKLRILRDKDESGRYELRHDSLATKIYEKITLVEKELLEVRHFLDNAYSNYEKRKKLLGPDDLDYVAPYERKLFLNAPLIRFIEASKREVQKTKRRRRQVIVILSASLFIILAAFTVWALNERSKAVEQRSIAEEERKTAEEQRNAAIRANEETEEARKQALEEKQRAEENERIAINQSQEAIEANEAAEAARHQALAEKFKAEENEKNALEAQAEAERHKSLAENERRIAEENYRKARASNLLVTAKEVQQKNPTVAIRLAEYSMGLDSNPHALATIQQIYSNNNFYKIIGKHRNAIKAVDISPDNTRIVTGSSDYTACLWDLDGNRLLTIKGHEDEITSVKFSPDGKHILTGSTDGTARLWDLAGNEIVEFTGHNDAVTSAAFSPGGNYLVTGSADHTARLWRIDGALIRILSGEDTPVTSVAVSPDENYILVAYKKNLARLFDFNGSSVQEFKAGNEDFWVNIGNITSSFPGNTNDILSVAFNSKEKQLITGSRDGKARLWTYAGKLISEIGNNSGEITSMAFSDDGEKIIIGTEDLVIRSWDIQGNLIAEYKGHDGVINSLAMSYDGKKLVSGSSDHTARVWDLSGNSVISWKAHNHGICAIAYSPKQEILLTGSVDKTACLWNAKGERLAIFEGHENRINDVCFSPDGLYVFTASNDKTVRLWDLHGNQLKVYKDDDYVQSIDISSDGKMILIGSWDTRAKIRDLDGNLIQTFGGHEWVPYVFFATDNEMIITVSGLSVRFWDLSGNIIRSFEGISSRIIYSADFSPGHNYIIAGAGGGLYIYDLSGNVIQYLPVHNDFSPYVTSPVAVSPDGKKVAASAITSIKQFDISGNLLQSFYGFEDEIQSIDYAPDGQRIIAGCKDGAVYIFNLKPPLDGFQMEGLYEQLGIYHRLEYGLLEYADVIVSKDVNDLIDGALFFSGRANESDDVNQKVDDLIKAESFYEKACQLDHDSRNYLGLAKVLINQIQSGLFNNDVENRLDEIFSIFDKEDDKIRILESAEFYHDLLSQKFSNELLEKFSTNAIHFYKKMLKHEENFSIYSKLMDIQIQKIVNDPSERNKQNLQKTFDELISIVQVDKLSRIAWYFKNIGEQRQKDRLAVAYLSMSVSLFEKILMENDDRYFKRVTSITYNNLAYYQLYTGQYIESIDHAKRGLEIWEVYYLYTNLPIAYLLNDQYDEAIEIINEYKDKRLGGMGSEKIGSSILIDLDHLNAAGIDHPDFEKVRELLKDY